MKICCIDDDPMKTLDVLEGLQKYYRDKSGGNELECRMLFMNIGEKNRDDETMSYYEKEVGDYKIDYDICVSLEEMKADIISKNNEEWKYLIDLHVEKDEGDKIDNTPDYKCISMECIEFLEREGLNFCCYSGYMEDSFKDKWQRRYFELYPDKDLPRIYERVKLTLTFFDSKLADEILEIR